MIVSHHPRNPSLDFGNDSAQPARVLSRSARSSPEARSRRGLRPYPAGPAIPALPPPCPLPFAVRHLGTNYPPEARLLAHFWRAKALAEKITMHIDSLGLTVIVRSTSVPAIQALFLGCAQFLEFDVYTICRFEARIFFPHGLLVFG